MTPGVKQWLNKNVGAAVGIGAFDFFFCFAHVSVGVCVNDDGNGNGDIDGVGFRQCRRWSGTTAVRINERTFYFPLSPLKIP